MVRRGFDLSGPPGAQRNICQLAAVARCAFGLAAGAQGAWSINSIRWIRSDRACFSTERPKDVIKLGN
jgi:hypothetical protein